MSHVTSIIENTNIALYEKNIATPMTQGEFFRYLGIRLAMSLNPIVGGYRQHWKTSMPKDSVLLAGNYFERFEMSMTRFESITSALRLSSLSNNENISDRWYPIRSFLDAFNDTRKANVTPGEFLTIDEYMCSWKGSDGKYVVNGMPHITKIKRKPKGVGAELKSIACAQSGIILGLEIVEGKEVDSTKKYADLGFGTAVTLRLSEPYRGFKRVIVADSAFSSVKTAVELYKHGFYFMGAIKTAHTKFPAKYLQKWFNDKDLTNPQRERGSFIALKSQFYFNSSEVDMYAIGWQDKKLKAIVSNCGTTFPGKPSVRLRSKLVQEDGQLNEISQKYYIPRPEVVETFFNNCNTINVHDHLRQGLLKLDISWQTKTWWHRVFATLFGMCVTDAYCAFRLEYMATHQGSTEGLTDFYDFIDILSYKLIHNDLVLNERKKRKRNSIGEVIDVS